MLFTTQIFIFAFFPLCIAVYFLTHFLQKKGFLSKLLQKIRFSDLALIGISFCFYLWACFDDIFRLAAYILLVYFLGQVIQKTRKRDLFFVAQSKQSSNGEQQLFSLAAPVFFIGIAALVLILIHFKYTDFLAHCWNFLFKDDLSGKSIIAPLGISFITFSAISYLADIYTGKEEAGTLIDCALYLSFFPKVVSGPIVLWRDFRGQIADRSISLESVSNGVTRIMIGFSKKLILADTFGACIASAGTNIDVPTAWGISLLYMLRLYYDFSGYSDIAIGLSNILGFSIKENFHFPYLSCSITEFWRRWHISLGTWFREYIYFPLGGSRRGKKQALVNVAIVFLLTGFWHGAGWAYMLWGIINGLCNIIEKLISEKTWYKKTPKILKWFATTAITFFCWQLFRFSSFSSSINWFNIMLHGADPRWIPYSWEHYFDTRMIVLGIIAIVGATLFGLPKVQELYKRITSRPIGYLVSQIIILLLFVVSVLFMINSTYNPFIYFQY